MEIVITRQIVCSLSLSRSVNFVPVQYLLYTRLALSPDFSHRVKLRSVSFYLKYRV